MVLRSTCAGKRKSGIVAEGIRLTSMLTEIVLRKVELLQKAQLAQLFWY